MLPGQMDLFTKRRSKRPPSPHEIRVHCMVADTLKKWCKPTWRYSHLPFGELREQRTAVKLKRMGVVAGWPDFALLGPPGFHGLEMKRRGEKLNDEQEAYAAFCEEIGVPYEVATTYGEAIEILSEWGCLKVAIDVLERRPGGLA